MKKRLRIIFYLIIAVIPIFSNHTMADTKYELIDLGSLGGVGTWGRDINDANQVVGFSHLTDNTTRKAFIWDEVNGIQELGSFTWQSWAYGINNHGHVVGEFEVTGTNGIRHAFIWKPNVGMIDLGTLGGQNSVAYGINDNGKVVGHAQLSNQIWHAVIWDTNNQTIEDLGTLGGPDSTGVDINIYGQAVGSSAFQSTSPPYHAYYLNIEGSMMDIGSIGGSQGINEYGQVTGYYSPNNSNTLNAFVWHNDFMLLDIGNLGGNASGLGINKSGTVVGRSIATDNMQHAFIWNFSQGMKDLNTFSSIKNSSWHLQMAYDINEKGNITGFGLNSGVTGGFVLLQKKSKCKIKAPK